MTPKVVASLGPGTVVTNHFTSNACHGGDGMMTQKICLYEDVRLMKLSCLGTLTLA